MRNILALFVLTTSLAYAHGENKLGPHKGFIRMPAMYHTELVPVNEKEFNVYLMNVNNQDPKIKDSEVELILNLNDKKIDEVKCQPKTDYFNCVLLKSSNVKNGKIIINSKRNNEKGKEAIYDLPLALK